MFILNGRTPDDDGQVSSFMTCKDKSVIDYFICSSTLFQFDQTLNVLEFCNMLSDSHTPVSLSMKFRGLIPGISDENPIPKIISWKTDP